MKLVDTAVPAEATGSTTPPSRWPVWIFRAGLLAGAAIAVLGLLDPAAPWAVIKIRPDRVSHGTFSYALALLSLASFPRAPAWIIGVAMFCMGVTVELAQMSGGIPGHAQFGDVVADMTGVLLAIAPVMLDRARAAGEMGKARQSDDQ